MGKSVDITGLRSGKLVALNKTHKSKTSGNWYWLCICDCGKEIKVKAYYIKNNSRKCCGCTIEEKRLKGFNKWLDETHRLEFGESSRNWLYNDYRHGAIKRSLIFDLDKEEFFKIVSSNCFYCNSIPKSKAKIGTGYGYFLYNGVDRIDSTKGYLKDNVLPCCKICNYSKRSLSVKEYVEWIEQISLNINNIKAIIK